MKKLIVICFVVFLANSSVHAQGWKGIDIYANSGFTISSAERRSTDALEPGYNFGFGFGKSISKTISISGYYDYYRFLGNIHYQKHTSFSINVKYSVKPESGKVLPYFIGGLGLIRLAGEGTDDTSVIPFHVPEIETSTGLLRLAGDVSCVSPCAGIKKNEKYNTLGINFGVGFEFPVGERTRMFIEGKYAFGFAEVSTLHFPIKWGVIFSVTEKPRLNIFSLLFGKNRKKTRLYVNSGFTVPVSADNVGVNYGGGMEMELDESFSMRCSYDYYSFSKNLNEKYKYKSKTKATNILMMHLKYKRNIGYMDIANYLLIGLGVYNRSYDEIIPGVTSNPSFNNRPPSKGVKETGGGLNLGLGLEMPVYNRTNIFVEGNYVLGKMHNYLKLFFPIKCGFTFEL